ncbi:MAG: hypothetical protein WCR92_09435 [Candidatus Cloacimonadaceae bacterium]
MIYPPLRIFLPLLVVCLLFACKTVQPPTYPVANMFPTVDIEAKLESLQPCLINGEQIQNALQNLHLWQILEKAGLPSREMATLTRGLNERGYAEIDARRATSPLIWISFTCPEKNKLFIRAAFAKIPPYACRQGMLLEKIPGDHSLRILTRNGQQIPQRVAIWRPYQRGEEQFQIMQVFAEKANTISHWEIHKEFTLPIESGG